MAVQLVVLGQLEQATETDGADQFFLLRGELLDEVENLTRGEPLLHREGVACVVVTGRRSPPG